MADDFSLTRPGLAGDWLGGPLQAFLAALMLLAALILLAACANLGSLFAARAADRSREVALRLVAGSEPHSHTAQLFTESVLISLVGGAVGLWGSILLLRGPECMAPDAHMLRYKSLNPGLGTCMPSLSCLAWQADFFLARFRYRQVLHTDPYQVIKSGPSAVGCGGG